jgi:TRAP-type mannitol/chloroaromatic compound transport system permease small subunit
MEQLGREGSGEAGGLPYVYLLKTLIPLSAFLLILQGIGQALASLGTLLAPHGNDNA